MLLLSGFSAQDADRIASEQNWQIAFDELSKLVMQRFRPELEDFLPEGMRWEQVEKSLATVGQVDSMSEFVAKVKSLKSLPETVWFKLHYSQSKRWQRPMRCNPALWSLFFKHSTANNS